MGLIQADSLLFKPVFEIAHLGVEDFVVIVLFELAYALGQLGVILDDRADSAFQFVTGKISLNSFSAQT